MAGFDYAGESATQAIYNNEWAPYRAQYGATTRCLTSTSTALRLPRRWQPHFWQDQFSSLYAMSSIGMSYYNAGQLTCGIRPATACAVVSYTWSNSIDMGSDAERAAGWADPARSAKS